MSVRSNERGRSFPYLASRPVPVSVGCNCDDRRVGVRKGLLKVKDKEFGIWNFGGRVRSIKFGRLTWSSPAVYDSNPLICRLAIETDGSNRVGGKVGGKQKLKC